MKFFSDCLEKDIDNKKLMWLLKFLPLQKMQFLQDKSPVPP